MRTSINFSAISQTTFYAVGKEDDNDKQFDLFIKAVDHYDFLAGLIESKTEDSIIFRFPEDAYYAQLNVNRIAMLCYNDCIYKDGKHCKKCEYKAYCDVIGGLRDGL